MEAGSSPVNPRAMGQPPQGFICCVSRAHQVLVTQARLLSSQVPSGWGTSCWPLYPTNTQVRCTCTRPLTPISLTHTSEDPLPLGLFNLCSSGTPPGPGTCSRLLTIQVLPEDPQGPAVKYTTHSAWSGHVDFLQQQTKHNLDSRNQGTFGTLWGVGEAGSEVPKFRSVQGWFLLKTIAEQGLALSLCHHPSFCPPLL